MVAPRLWCLFFLMLETATYRCCPADPICFKSLCCFIVGAIYLLACKMSQHSKIPEDLLGIRISLTKRTNPCNQNPYK
ncbi:hypothetical protein WN943_010158 [Citrus x changshan-huyou]